MQTPGVSTAANLVGENINPGGDIMKRLASLIVALGLAIAFTAPAFAAAAGGAQPLNKEDCTKAHMKWDSTAMACKGKGSSKY
jgi:hypothetical protein